MMKSFPFDGQLEKIEEIQSADGQRINIPILDRGYTSEDLQEFDSYFFTSGISQKIENCFKVSPATGMQITVAPGFAFCGGARCVDSAPTTLNMEVSDTSQDRIDTVIIRKDNTIPFRDARIYLIKGSPSNSPVPRAPVKTKEIYEIVLAHVRVRAGTTSIAPRDITDTRLNSELCGIMMPIPGVDTTGIFTQYQDALDEFLHLVQDAIDGTIAGNLKQEISKLEKNKQDILAKGDAKGSINDIKTQGVYWIRKTEVADSVYDFAQLIVQESSAGTITQILIQYQRDSVSGRTATRFFANGKWSYWFKNVLREDVANNLTTASEGSVLDARQGKILNDSTALKSYNPVTLGINNNTSINQIIEGGLLPPGATIELWINDDTNYGRQIREGIRGAFGEEFYGCCYITRESTSSTRFLRCFRYNDFTTYLNLYTQVNSVGWMKKWKKIDENLLANNLTTTVAGYSLDARQGKILKGLIDGITSAINLLKSIYSNGSAFKFNGESTNLLYSSYDMGIYHYGGNCTGAPSTYTGYMLVLRQNPTSNLVRVAFSTDGMIYYAVQKPDGTVEHNWRGI